MKNDKQGIVVICVLMIALVILIGYVYKTIAEKEKSYEYAKNAEIFKSNNCYIEEDIAYCEYEDKIIQVDNYYEINKGE